MLEINVMAIFITIFMANVTGRDKQSHISYLYIYMIIICSYIRNMYVC